MTEKKKVAIVGAGIGGITTAVFLAKNGFDVTIYEKNPSPGGRCGQFIRDGHRFDLGATMLLMPGVYHEIFNSLGISLEENKDIVQLEDLYRIYFDDCSALVCTSDRERMKQQLEKIEPGSFKKAEKYVSDGYEIYKLGMEKLIRRNFYNLFQFANFQNLVLLARLKVYISHWSYTRRFFKDPHLLMAYTFQNIYVGQSPFNAPALFSMVPAAEFKEGSFFPKGGMFAIVEKLNSAAEAAGVQFVYNNTIKEIIIRDNRAKGIVLEDYTPVMADIVISNADLPYAYRELLPDKCRSSHLEKMKYSCSAICFHWGLDKVYPQLSHHNVFLSDSFREALDRIFIDKTVDDKPSFYVHAPTRTDKSAAPDGHDSISVIVGAGHVDESKDQDWNTIKKQTREAVIARLKQQGLDDFDEHIKFEISYTPETWESATHVRRGSVFGSLSHSIFQMGYFRPHNRHDKYPNLYFVGGSTHPGNGIPNVLMSAKLVSERIMAEQTQNNNLTVKTI
jgi:phytoene desaturase